MDIENSLGAIDNILIEFLRRRTLQQQTFSYTYETSDDADATIMLTILHTFSDAYTSYRHVITELNYITPFCYLTLSCVSLVFQVYSLNFLLANFGLLNTSIGNLCCSSEKSRRLISKTSRNCTSYYC